MRQQGSRSRTRFRKKIGADKRQDSGLVLRSCHVLCAPLPEQSKMQMLEAKVGMTFLIVSPVWAIGIFAAYKHHPIRRVRVGAVPRGVVLRITPRDRLVHRALSINRFSNRRRSCPDWTNGPGHTNPIVWQLWIVDLCEAYSRTLPVTKVGRSSEFDSIQNVLLLRSDLHNNYCRRQRLCFSSVGICVTSSGTEFLQASTARTTRCHPLHSWLRRRRWKGPQT